MLVEEAVKPSNIHPRPQFKSRYDNFIGAAKGQTSARKGRGHVQNFGELETSG